MNTPPVTRLFAVRSHNPSFHTVQNSGAFSGEVLDFCVPVNPHFPPPALTQLICENLEDILRYYPDYADVHQKHIAQLAGIPAETIVPANGSTEIITALCQEASGPIVTSVPTFGRWTDLPIELGLPLHTIPRRRANGFRLEVDEIVRRVREVGAQTLVISNPNNPTGAGFTAGQIRTLAARLPHLHTVIVDESFIDFSDLGSVAAYAGRSHNVVVVKSMGKSLGWHGVRLGYAVAKPTRAQALRSRLPYWNINGLAAFVLKSLPQFQSEYRASFVQTAKDRSYLFRRLSSLSGLTVFPSHANFLFVELPDNVSGRHLRDRLLTNYGVLVRETSNKAGSTEKYLRLAVQDRAANDVLIHALSAELSPLFGSASPA